jgi:UDP-N-acetylmuramoyl-tripeptide--D-alanyl-D-alanine ligase
MSLFTREEIIAALTEELIAHNLPEEIYFDEIFIDSRKVVKNGMFFALKGDNNDGHNFLQQSFESGSVVGLIDNLEFYNSKNNFILVKNTFSALYKLAEFSRKRSSAKFIAITGSVGKTSVKEMLRLVFFNQKKTFATNGNFNNHIGLPLTLCNVPRDTEIAILEIGMNHLGEIEQLSMLAKPDVAVITSIAKAHIGNFKNEDEIALAKSEIFAGLNKDGIALINGDSNYCEFLEKRAKSFYNIKQQNILTFGKNNNCNYKLLKAVSDECLQSAVNVGICDKNKISYKISSVNKAAIFNSLISVACLDIMRAHINQGLQALENFTDVSGRGKLMFLKVGEKNIAIIDDSYNANVSSMKAGIEYLSDLKKMLHKKRSVAILGDMFELGDEALALHQEVIKCSEHIRIDYALLVGNTMSQAGSSFIQSDDFSCEVFSNLGDLLIKIKTFIEDGDIILIKGSRGMKMEKIIQHILL